MTVICCNTFVLAGIPSLGVEPTKLAADLAESQACRRAP